MWEKEHAGAGTRQKSHLSTHTRCVLIQSTHTCSVCDTMQTGRELLCTCAPGPWASDSTNALSAWLWCRQIASTARGHGNLAPTPEQGVQGEEGRHTVQCLWRRALQTTHGNRMQAGGAAAGRQAHEQAGKRNSRQASATAAKLAQTSVRSAGCDDATCNPACRWYLA